MIHEFINPKPVIVKKSGEKGYAIYVETSAQFENDLWTIVLCDGGDIITCRIDQLRMYKNSTFGITEKGS